ncbi:MAG: hypothetical protein NUV56_01650 [Candidatus Uhrbacteria bacterium]|nr:hypothetical protein [Candidatus Uhrbacteria bacterium]
MSSFVRYANIDFRPPTKVGVLAEKGLAFRDQYHRGGTEVGIARGRDLKNRVTLSPMTIKRMVSYFARHTVDKRAPNFGNDKKPSNGYIAWLLWGGDAGQAWALSVRDKMRKADEKMNEYI